MRNYRIAYDACLLASQKHAGQVYGSYPYMYHIQQVVDTVVRRFDYGNVDMLVLDELMQVAYLHDAIEDTDLTGEDLIVAGYKPRVVDAIMSLTKLSGISYESYIENVRANPMALEVKMCDTMANLNQSFLEGSSYRIQKYSKQLQLLEAN